MHSKAGSRSKAHSIPNVQADDDPTRQLHRKLQNRHDRKCVSKRRKL